MDLAVDYSDRFDEKVTEISLDKATGPKYEPGDFNPLEFEVEKFAMDDMTVTQKFLQLGLDQFSERLQVAAHAAFAAGQAIASKFGKAEHVSIKGAGDIVTECDLVAEQLIIHSLRERFPSDCIVSEELSSKWGSVLIPGATHTWIIDPLDGTAAFRFGTATNQPSIMITSASKTQLESSVIYFPFTDEMFLAEVGKGAYKNFTKISLADMPLSTQLSDYQVIMNHYGDARYESSFFQSVRDNLRQPGKVGLLTIYAPHSGVACRMLERPQQLGAIVHDNNPVKPKQEVWDIAPVLLMMREAGAVVVSPTGADYVIGSNEPIIIANSHSIAKQIIAEGVRPRNF